MASNNSARFRTSPDWVTAFVVMSEDIGALLKKHVGVNLTQARILYQADLSGKDARVGDIARTLKLRPNTATAAIDALEKKSFVIREREAQDRRAVCLKITAEGKLAVNTFGDCVRIYWTQLEKNLSSFQMDRFKKTLKPLIEDSPYAKEGPDSDIVSAVRGVDNFVAELTALDRRMGVSFVEGRILSYLSYIGEPIRLSPLSTALCLRPNVVTISMDALEEKGLARRDPDPHDHRAVLLSPTKAGDEAVGNYAKNCAKLVDDYFGSLPPKPPQALLSHSFKQQ